MPSVRDIMKIKLSKKEKRWLENCRMQILIGCLIHGHDFRNVDKIDGGPVCVRCGVRPKAIQPTG